MGVGRSGRCQRGTVRKGEGVDGRWWADGFLLRREVGVLIAVVGR